LFTAQINVNQLIDIKTAASEYVSPILTRLIGGFITLSAPAAAVALDAKPDRFRHRLIALTIDKNRNDQTMRWQTISNDGTLASSRQYSGNTPQQPNAAIAHISPCR